jgi:hypothetical protein
MTENEEKSARADNDGAWKHILSAHLKDFVEFFWPEAYQAIDWTRPYELLEQELMAIGVNEEIGKRYIDKLFKVHLLNGQEQWLLLHIEIQNTKDETFPERMFTIFIGSLIGIIKMLPVWQFWRISIKNGGLTNTAKKFGVQKSFESMR